MFQYLSQVPRGKKVAAADFVTVFGAAAAAELSKRGVQSVSESKGRISVAALQEQEFPLLKQGRMRLAAQSSFAYQGTDNRIRITAIQGVTVTRPGAPGWVNLDGIELSPGAAGQVRVSSKVSKFLLSLTLDETYSIKDMEGLGWQLPKGFSGKSK
ncbi:MAG TPA: hypothetical protein PLF23_04265 [Candidatus Obscuribacter sp.]|nr:hypothetical protein [Candidatus Obscuribacter sp.]HNH72961.1 hypothetical protein [Candidatus Obscuribacter sp.]